MSPSEKTQYEKDLEMGLKAENDFKDYFKKRYKIDLLGSRKSCFYDFFLPKYNIMIELKRRNINKNRFKTTTFPYDKITKFEKLNKRGIYKFIIVFHFNDGIFYFLHKSSRKYDVQMFQRKKRTGTIDYRKEYVFYPVDKLIPINKLKPEIINK